MDVPIMIYLRELKSKAFNKMSESERFLLKSNLDYQVKYETTPHLFTVSVLLIWEIIGKSFQQIFSILGKYVSVFAS